MSGVLNSTVLRAIAASWLRYKKQCPVVSFERGLNAMDRPDVYALTKERLLLEIEIKCSWTDFKKDSEKWKWRSQERGWGHIPAFFYYLAPMVLAERIKPLLPAGVGLLTVPRPERLTYYTGLPNLTCLVKPRRHKSAAKVRVQDVIEIIKHQSGTLCGLAAAEGVLALRALTQPTDGAP